MANFIKGDVAVLFIKVSDLFQPVGCLSTTGLNEGAEELDVTTVDSGEWKTSIPRLQNYSLNFNGFLTDEILPSFTDPTGKMGLYTLRQIKRARTIFDWEIRTANGVYIDYGKGWISDLGQVQTVENYITFNGTIQGYGRLLQQGGNVAAITWDNSDLTFDSTLVTWDNG